MNTFNAFSLVTQLHVIDNYYGIFGLQKVQGQGGSVLDQRTIDDIRRSVDYLRATFKARGIQDCSDACDFAIADFGKPYLDASTGHTMLHAFKRSIMEGFKKRKFLYVAEDRTDFVDHRTLFGDMVTSAFPSASRDIQEAGNCLAAECQTAAVFHLMRCAEFGLHALARDRDVEFPDKPLEEKEWGQILSNLDRKIKELGLSARNSWASSETRDLQIRFYAEALQELRGFNEAFRRHISHADRTAFYNRETAAGIMQHVKVFMQKLASKISETSVTEKYWK